MIIITTQAGIEFKYEGDILLKADDIFISIRADKYEEDFASRINIHDLFWLDDVKSIRGET